MRSLGFVRVETLNRIQVRVHGDSMWPTLRDGDCVEALQGPTPVVGDIVVAHHPMKRITVIKRVKSILHDGLFIEGDNPDPLGSDDSHNFGPVPHSSIIGVIPD